MLRTSHEPGPCESQGCPEGQTRKDYQTRQEIRWCPGCGDYAILAQVHKVLPLLGIPKENLVFVSGIGCASRFPYYVNTYGIHGIHGRAPAIAMGVKCANPELSVWIVTGDGDALSIGTNHLIHCMRRNLDVNILLLNNRIYGLTKGQYSPTSTFGKRTKSSPFGSIEQPISPVRTALAAEATFVARTVYTDQAHMARMIEAAARHRGTSFVEILQNCRVFNDGEFDRLTDRELRDDERILLEHGEPIVFGKQRDKAIGVRNMEPVVIDGALDGASRAEALVHNVKTASPALASLLAALEPPDFPTALGVFRDVEKPTYDELLTAQIQDVMNRRGRGDLDRLLTAGTTWEID